MAYKKNNYKKSGVKETDWGMHWESVKELHEARLRAQEISETVFSSNNDELIPTYVSCLNNIKRLLLPLLTDAKQEYYLESFANCITMLRQQNIDKQYYIQQPPFKQIKKKFKDYELEGKHSFLPFLYQAHDEFFIIMHQAGLLFKKTKKVTDSQIKNALQNI